jgi:hypothetical protein
MKKPPQDASPPENPFRQYDPVTFDKGAKINEVAASVRHLASSKLQGSELLAALQTALGAEVAASVVREHPNDGPDTQLYIIDQILDGIAPGVREAAYIAADLPDPRPCGNRELTAEEFVELTYRIVNAATKNDVPETDSVAATAKALGHIICFVLAERPEISEDEMIKHAQEAVANFARQAIEYRKSHMSPLREARPVSSAKGPSAMKTPSEFEGVPISHLIDTRHEFTALINQNLYGGGSKPTGQAALAARNALDDWFFGLTEDKLVEGNPAALALIKRAIIDTTYGELALILDDYSRRFGHGGKAIKQGMSALLSDPDVFGRFNGDHQTEIQAIAAGFSLFAKQRFDQLCLSIRKEAERYDGDSNPLVNSLTMCPVRGARR